MSACLLFTGSVNNVGYGLKYYRGKLRSAHRVAYCIEHKLDIDTLSREQVIRHSCDNRLCINPEHLLLGTQAENCQERSVRAPRGEKRKLTANQVETIKTQDPGKIGRCAAAALLGLTYSVNESTIRKIWYGKYWGHL